MTDLGRRCICETRTGVTNIVIIERRAPVAGTGWGCVVCGLPSDGAVAVLCDRCMELVHAGAVPIFVCRGYAGDDQRAPYTEVSREVFAHNDEAHRQYEASA